VKERAHRAALRRTGRRLLPWLAIAALAGAATAAE
jgi:hypothetical protein